jgi:hypothetical protein
MTVALFNIQKGTGIETRAFIRGIKGFFYRSDSLSQHQLQQRRDHRQVAHQPEHGKDPSSLDLRNWILEKTKVPTRFQAALWATKSL